jgi:hypothetical protein
MIVDMLAVLREARDDDWGVAKSQRCGDGSYASVAYHGVGIGHGVDDFLIGHVSSPSDRGQLSTSRSLAVLDDELLTTQR